MTDIVVVVPKRDELAGVLHVLGRDAAEGGDEELNSGVELYRLRLPSKEQELAITVALLDRQTNTNSGILTLDAIHRESPLQIYLVGTALGNPNHSPIGSVFVARHVTDISERRPSIEDIWGWQPNSRSSHKSLVAAASTFVLNRYWSPEARKDFYRQLQLPAHLHGSLFDDTIHMVEGKLPEIAPEPIISGNEYIMLPVDDQPDATEALWSKFSPYRAYDMEAAGFCLAADSAGVPWLVIRGTSDYGSGDTKADRVYAAAAAAKLLREFIESGRNNLSTIRAKRPKFVGAGMLPLAGEYRGFMGYRDDNSELVVYEDTCYFENLGNVVVAEIESKLIEGVESDVNLRYTVDFTMARDRYAAGTWAEEDEEGSYFGSICGMFTHENTELAGVWTGNHGQGIRVGRFRWYNLGTATEREKFATPQGRSQLTQRFIQEMNISGVEVGDETV